MSDTFLCDYIVNHRIFVFIIVSSYVIQCFPNIFGGVPSIVQPIFEVGSNSYDKYLYQYQVLFDNLDILSRLLDIWFL